ncbi:cell surface A33 antigen, partial [Silurus asotus]
IFCCVFVFCIAICATLGLQVTIPQSMYEVARGDEVIITCSFQPQNPVNRLIIISWIGEADGSFDDEGITFGTFYSDDGHVDINAMYEGKVQIESDVSKKVSNLILKQVTLRESRRIKCIVQIPGDTEGRTSDSTSLVVLVAPSNPVCKIKGTAEYGQNISLSCVSEEGSPTPTYQWQSYDVKNIPRSFPPKTTEKDGVLSLFNVSMDTSGYYICTSTNKINSAKCNLTLSVMPSTMKIGATAGIIGGCIAGVAVLVLIIYCACKDKPKPEEFAMEPPMVEYHGIPAEEKKGDERKTSIEGHIDQRERYKMKAEKDTDRDSNHRFDDDDQPPEMHDDHRENYSRDYNEDRRDYYDDRKHQYNDQHNNYDDRRGQYDDRQYRSDGRGHYRQNRYDDRNSFDDRREVYDDRQGRYDNHRYRYADREDHYNDHRERYERQGQYTDCDER